MTRYFYGNNMNIQSVELITSTITLVMAYMIAVTIAGSFRAWVARLFGDDTAESMGLLTLNPLAHIDFLGGFFLIFLGFGWGRHVPINPLRISGSCRKIKIGCAYLSNTVAHLFMATIAFTLLIFTFGLKVIHLAIPMIYTGNLLQSQFAQAYPEASSIAITLGLIGIALIYLNVLLAVLDFIISFFSLIAYTMLEGSSSYTRYRDVLMIVLPMLMIYFFIDPLRLLVVRLLLIFGWFFLSIFGGLN